MGPEGEESWALSEGCAWLPAPHPQLTTPQGKRGSATDPRGAWILGSHGESHRAHLLSPLHHPFSPFLPAPYSPLPSVFPVFPSLTFSCAKLTKTITKLVFLFLCLISFEASCYARWVPPPGPSGRNRGQPTPWVTPPPAHTPCPPPYPSPTCACADTS